jgi:TolA-binding protein
MIPEQPKDEHDIARAAVEALAPLVHGHRGRLTALQRAQGARSLIAALGWGESGRGARSRPDAAWSALSGRGRWASAWACTLFFATTAAAVMVFAVHHHATRPLSFTIDGGKVERNGFIETGAAAPKLVFSDGSQLFLDRNARASLSEVDGRGGRVALTEGSAHVDIVHRPQARWLFDAGPFLISVTGTAFTFGWKPGDEQLDVQMERGSVDVSGPLSDGPIALRSGQHLTVRVRQRETVIRDVQAVSTPEATTTTPSAPSEVATAGAEARRTEAAPGAVEAKPMSSPRRPREGVCRGWSAQLTAGDFEGIVREAQRAGIENCLAQAESTDLAALADAARYGRHDEIARRALLAQRRRFPVSAEGRDATFLLGRLEETEQNLPKAVAWYDAYLEQASNGTYASEALGRKMMLTQQLSGSGAARTTAAEYVDRFPRGTYAVRARAIARAP